MAVIVGHTGGHSPTLTGQGRTAPGPCSGPEAGVAADEYPCATSGDTSLLASHLLTGSLRSTTGNQSLASEVSRRARSWSEMLERFTSSRRRPLAVCTHCSTA